MGAFYELEAAAPLIEASAVPDIYCTGIARIENLGDGCFRYVLFVSTQAADGQPERVIVARLVGQRSNTLRAVRQIMASVLDGVPPGMECSPTETVN